MAKIPTPALAAASAAAAKPATENTAQAAEASSGNGGGTQPWATPITTTADVPSSPVSEIAGDRTGDNDALGTQKQAEALAENDVAKTPVTQELPSFVRDQISPSGVDLALEAHRGELPDLERSAYPSLGERVTALISGASDELKQKFFDRMAEVAEDVINELRSAAVDDSQANLLVDGNSHYGTAAANATADGSAEAPGISNAERNRRARRAAERVAAASVK